VAHVSLELLGTSNLPASTSRIAGTTGMPHHAGLHSTFECHQISQQYLLQLRVTEQQGHSGDHKAIQMTRHHFFFDSSL
jgi:hypothetical protein